MPRNDGYGDTEQEYEPRKSGATHIRKSYALALVTALIFYLLGSTPTPCYSRPRQGLRLVKPP